MAQRNQTARAGALCRVPIDREHCPDFSWHEIACQRTGLIRPTVAMYQHMCRVQQLRWWWDAPITVSGARTPLHNATEGGGGFSQHLLFTGVTLAEMAVDNELATMFATDLHFSLTSPRLEPYFPWRYGERKQRAIAVRMAAEHIETYAAGTNGVGLYDWGIHWDPRPNKARWDERTFTAPEV